jgi:N-acetylmuramoyl-L-alanine amidase
MVGVTYFAGEKITSVGGADSAVSAQSKITVIIDAGHGGIDGGASAEDGTLEKHLNLAVAMKIKALLSFADVNVVMTRESDVMLASPDSAHKKRDDLNARLHMAEKYEDCIFVSIHMNKFPVEKYSGLQVYYSGNNPGSELLAEAIREKNTSYLQTQNSRGVKKADSSIYVLDNIRVPAVLVECGFLSNREEAALLKTEAYQDKLAAIICAGILEYIDK